MSEVSQNTPDLSTVDLAHAELPRRIGSFEIQDLLAKSSTALVLDAYDVAGQHVALALAQPPADKEGGDVVELHLRQVRVLRHLNHPGLIQLTDGGELDGLLFVAVERTEGRTLLSLRQQRELDLGAVLGVGVQIGATLAQLHEVGLVHRDIQSGSIIIDSAGTPILTDLGVPLITTDEETSTRSPIRTDGLIAPEVRDGARPSPASDQFALGMLLLELCTKRSTATSDGEGAGDTASLHDGFSVKWEHFRTDEELTAVRPILERMLDRRPESRYPDMHACVAALADLGARRGGEEDKPRTLMAPEQPDEGAISLATLLAPAEPDAIEAFSEGMVFREAFLPIADLGVPQSITQFVLIPAPEDPSPVSGDALVRRLEARGQNFWGSFEKVSSDLDVATQLQSQARRFWRERFRSEESAESHPEPSASASDSEIFSEESTIRVDPGLEPPPEEQELRSKLIEASKAERAEEESQSHSSAGWRSDSEDSVSPSVGTDDDFEITISGLFESTSDEITPGTPTSDSGDGDLVLRSGPGGDADWDDERVEIKRDEFASSDVQSADAGGFSLEQIFMVLGITAAGIALGLILVLGVHGGFSSKPSPVTSRGTSNFHDPTFVRLIEPPSERASPQFRFDPSHKASPEEEEAATVLLDDARKELDEKSVESAIGSLGRCIELADLADCHKWLGLILSILEDPSARVHLERYTKLAPNADDAESIRSILSSGS